MLTGGRLRPPLLGSENESRLGDRFLAQGVRDDVVPDESVAVGRCDRLGSAVDAELGEEMLDVGRDGLWADHERRRDLLLRLSLAQDDQDLALPRAEADSRALHMSTHIRLDFGPTALE